MLRSNAKDSSSSSSGSFCMPKNLTVGTEVGLDGEVATTDVRRGIGVPIVDLSIQQLSGSSIVVNL